MEKGRRGKTDAERIMNGRMETSESEEGNMKER